MEDVSEMEVIAAEPGKGRKKVPNKSNWKREKAKTAR